jgi:hypothetical protein
MASRLLTWLFYLWAFGPVASAAAYQEIFVENGGTIRGQVFLQGERPKPGFLPVHKNKDVCGTRMPDESLQVGPDGELRNVVVLLDGVLEGKHKISASAVLDNSRCSFVPRVQTLLVGQALELRNSDPILHAAHARLNFRETLFNFGLPVWRRVYHEFQVPGLVVIDCDVLHTWMRAYIVVTEHPYATVTDAQGRFTLDQVPAGRYTLRLWHERLGTQTTPVFLVAEQTVSLKLVYPPVALRTGIR